MRRHMGAATRAARATAVLHRVPHARQRDGGRGHRAGGVSCAARAIRPASVRVARRRTRPRSTTPARASTQLRSARRAPRALRRHLAARAAARRRRRPGRPRRAATSRCSLAFLVVLERSGRSSGRCSCCARCSTATTPRSPRSSSGPRRLPADLQPGPAGTSPSGRPRFDPPSRRGAELADAFFAALDAGDVDGLESCSPTTWCSTATAAARARRSGTRSHGALRVARFLAGLARQGHRYGALLEPAVVNGSPGLRVLDPAGRLVNVLGDRLRATAGWPGSGRSSTRTSCGTSARWRRRPSCSAAGLSRGGNAR